jgi:hypothetical protein
MAGRRKLGCFRILGIAFLVLPVAKILMPPAKGDFKKKKEEKKKNVHYQAQEQHLVDRFSLMGFSSTSGSAIESTAALAGGR